MEWLFDPNMWAGLLTLVVLEVVLGIDNLVFIAILADKLPPHQRDKARVIGLTLALVMRLLLLSLISWLVTLTTPLFSFFDFFQPSGKDLILLGGGIFLLFKATTELHERLENHSVFDAPKRVKIAFWKVVVQIVALDAVFSLDAVITAVGMVQSLPLMMAAVIIAVGIMLLASKPLTNFVSAHPSVVVLCLGFLLMIGFSLVAEAFHFAMPKGYLYAAIGFSIIIEAFNQVISRNKKKQESRKPLRMRTAETVLRLLNSVEEETDEVENISELEQKVIQSEAQNMLYSVLTLTDRSVRSIMTPRTEVIWIDIEDDIQTIRDLVENSSHSVFPVRYKENDEIVGVARDKELLTRFKVGSNVQLQDIVRAPLVVQESIGVLRLMEMMRKSSAKLSFVTNEYGAILGIITLQDIFEAIAGDFPDADEVPELLIEAENVWQVDAGMDLHRLEFILETDELVNNSGGHVTTLGGYITQQIGKVPKEGEKFTLGNLQMEVLVASARKIERVKVTKQKADASE